MPNYSITNADGSRETRVENYDGTATITATPAGGEPVVTVVASDEQPPVEPPTSPEVVAAQVIREEIDTRLAPSDVNSIAEMKTAIRDGLDAAVTRLGG